jgi:hypothetical protein
LQCATAALVLTGCVYRPPNYSYRIATPEEAAALQMPVTCESKTACDVAWRKATAWVVENSGWKVQVATDSLVQTFGPGTQSATLAFTLVRKPLADGWEELALTASCNEDGFPCYPIPTAERARARFAIFMRTR